VKHSERGMHTDIRVPRRGGDDVTGRG